MTTRRRQRFVFGQAVWMLVSLSGLAAFGLLSLRLYFVFALVGLLVVTEVTAPFAVTPEWRWRLRVLLVASMAVFGYIVLRRAFHLLPEGLV